MSLSYQNFQPTHSFTYYTRTTHTTCVPSPQIAINMDRYSPEYLFETPEVEETVDMDSPTMSGNYLCIII